MKKKPYLNEQELVSLLGVIAFNHLIYQVGRFLGSSQVHTSLATWMDAKIPFLPWTVCIYWGCYLFWTINYCIGTHLGRENGNRFLISHFLGESVCFLCFVLFPTEMVRPEVAGHSLLEQIVLLTYRNDPADNLLPSIHCFASWLCWVGLRKEAGIPIWYKWASLLMAIAVCISTLTVKQHVIADVFAGILLAEGSYACAGILHRFLAGVPKERAICSSKVYNTMQKNSIRRK